MAHKKKLPSVPYSHACTLVDSRITRDDALLLYIRRVGLCITLWRSGCNFVVCHGVEIWLCCGITSFERMKEGLEQGTKHLEKGGWTCETNKAGQLR